VKDVVSDLIYEPKKVAEKVNKRLRLFFSTNRTKCPSEGITIRATPLVINDKPELTFGIVKVKIRPLTRVEG
jgi:hypothetical protein